MNVRAWSVSLLLFLSTVTAVGQTVNRYLNTPLPKEWEESGEVFQQTLPVDDHWWKSFQDTKLDSLIALAVDRNYSVAMAINRIAAARANLWAERGNFFPSIGLNAGWADENQWKYQYLTSVYRSLLRCCTQYELGNRCLRQYP